MTRHFHHNQIFAINKVLSKVCALGYQGDNNISEELEMKYETFDVWRIQRERGEEDQGFQLRFSQI